MLKVAFAGYSSSGKSSIINAIAGKKILDIERNEEKKEVIYVAEENDLNIKNFHKCNLLSDDEISFNAVEIPEDGTIFDVITDTILRDIDIIIWVSDISKAFTTFLELKFYKKIKKTLKKLQYEHGKPYRLKIILSKCDREETIIFETIERIKNDLPYEEIMLFNAFGRCQHHEKISTKLKKFVNGIGNFNNINTEFKLKDHVNCMDKQLCRMYVEAFTWRLIGYLTWKKNADLTEYDICYILKIIKGYDEEYYREIIHYMIFPRNLEISNMTTVEVKKIYKQRKLKDNVIYTLTMLENTLLNSQKEGFKLILWEKTYEKFYIILKVLNEKEIYKNYFSKYFSIDFLCYKFVTYKSCKSYEPSVCIDSIPKYALNHMQKILCENMNE